MRCAVQPNEQQFIAAWRAIGGEEAGSGTAPVEGAQSCGVLHHDIFLQLSAQRINADAVHRTRVVDNQCHGGSVWRKILSPRVERYRTEPLPFAAHGIE